MFLCFFEIFKNAGYPLEKLKRAEQLVLLHDRDHAAHHKSGIADLKTGPGLALCVDIFDAEPEPREVISIFFRSPTAEKGLLIRGMNMDLNIFKVAKCVDATSVTL